MSDQTPAPPSAGSSALILIVDDVPENIRILGNILSEQDFRVAVATNGPQALRIASLSRPDLILLDVQMPEMDGYEVCRRLKLEEGTSAIPVIFLTARVEPEDVLHGFHLGAVDYVSKPFRSAELIARVSTQIQLARTRQELIGKNELLDRTIAELRDTNVAKDRFFSIVAHDLRNPFQGLLGYSDLLRQDLDVLDMSEIRAYVEQIHQICSSTYTMLDNMLEWSRIQLNRLEVDPRPIDPVEVVERAIAMVPINAAAKNITIVNTVEPGLHMMADEKVLHSVLLNLLSNAIKFTREGGRVTIAARRSFNEIVISVEDTGVGMSPSDQQKLFRIDKQHSTRGTSNEKGTGLGLLLCKDMLAKISGKIWCSSVEGRGSTLYFSLPDADATHQ